MSFDDQIRETLERVTTRLRVQLEQDLAGFSDELKRAATDEREQATRQAAEAAAAVVRREAAAQMAEVHEATRRRVEDLQRTAAEERDRAVREAAETAAADVRRQVEVQIAQLQETAQREAFEIRHAAAEERDRSRQEAAEAATAETQRQADAQIAQLRETAQQQTEEIERAAEVQIAALRNTLQAQLEDVRRAAAVQVEQARIELAAAQAEAEKKIGEAVDRTRTDAHQADLAQAARLVDAVRTLDDARSLVETLDALAACAAGQVERAAVLLVKADSIKGPTLRGWRLAGFDDDTPAKDIELDLDEAGLAGAVVRTGVSVSRQAVEAEDEQAARQQALPPFAKNGGARHAMALPVVVGGRVVAVLYGDAPQSEGVLAGGRWPATLEVLARHASRALEATTMQQAAGLSLPRLVPRAPQAALPGPIEQGNGGDEDAARRYARLLVSEIRMYHEPLVDAGRQSHDLRMRLGGEIDRARRLYEARVPATVREKSDYFEQELVRTLADGDRSLLG